MDNNIESFNKYVAKEFAMMARKMLDNPMSEDEILGFLNEQIEFVNKRKAMLAKQNDPDFWKPFGSEEPVSKPKEFEPLQDFGTPEESPKGFGM